MRETDRSHENTQSLRQTKVLDLAAEHPDASIEWIAEEVLAATPDYVESVLDTYGDPATEEPSAVDSDGEASTTNHGKHEPLVPETPTQPTTASDGGTSKPHLTASGGDNHNGSHEEGSPAATEATTQSDPDTNGEMDAGDAESLTNEETDESEETGTSNGSLPSHDELTETQVETLTAIQARPDATQRELGEILSVSAPTINNRVNGIPGFEWADRHAFVDAVLESESSDRTDETGTTSDVDGAKSVADGKVADGGDDDNPSLESGTESEPKSKSEPDPDPDTSDPEASPTGPKTDDITTSSDAPGAVRSTGETSHQHRLEELLDQLEAVSERLETAMEDPSPANAASEAEDSGADPQLAHKAIHACMNSQHISEEDELEIIRRLT